MSINDNIREHIQVIDRFLAMPESIGFSLGGLAEDLVNCISDEGAVPYTIGTYARYRTTPLASVLYYLNEAGLLPYDAIHTMQDQLFFYRDNMKIVDPSRDDVHNKDAVDTEGWSIDEGVSVWTTSMSIISLISSGFIERDDSAKIAKLKNSIIWLVEQQYDDGYWCFQKFDSCTASVPMTSLAIRALTIARVSKISFGNTNGEGTKLNRAITSGIKWLKDNVVTKDDVAYWLFSGEPSVVATAWAIQAIYEEDTRNRSENRRLYQKAIPYILESIPSEITKDNIDKWTGGNVFVNETRTKYKGEKPKLFYAFMPSILPTLINIGLNPMDVKVVAVIRHLVKDYRRWVINDYDNKPCTFSIAMALYVIVKWFEEIENGTYRKVIVKLFNNGVDKCIVCPFNDISKNAKQPPKKSKKPKRKVNFDRSFIVSLIGAILSFFGILISLAPAITKQVMPFLSSITQKEGIINFLSGISQFLVSSVGAVITGILANIIYSKIKGKRG